MPQRLQIQDLQPAQSRPAAAPIDLFTSPSIARPAVSPLPDLAPLSASLQRFLSRRRQDEPKHEAFVEAQGLDDIERDRTRADEMAEAVQRELEGISDPAEASRVMARVLRGFQTQGGLPASGDPVWIRGQMRGFGRQALRQARQNLTNRIPELIQIVDEDGGLILPDRVEGAIREEFAKASDHFALRSFYGRQEFAAGRQQVEEEFRGRVVAARAPLVEAQREAQVENEIASGDLTLNSIGLDGFEAALGTGGISPDMVQGLTDHLNALHDDENVTNIRPLALNAINVKVSDLLSRDEPEAATELLDAFEEVAPGGLSFGDDKSQAVRTRLLALRNRVEKAATEKEADDIALFSARRRTFGDIAASRIRDAIETAKEQGLEAEPAAREAEAALFEDQDVLDVLGDLEQVAGTKTFQAEAREIRRDEVRNAKALPVPPNSVVRREFEAALLQPNGREIAVELAKMYRDRGEIGADQYKLMVDRLPGQKAARDRLEQLSEYSGRVEGPLTAQIPTILPAETALELRDSALALRSTLAEAAVESGQSARNEDELDQLLLGTLRAPETQGAVQGYRTQVQELVRQAEEGRKGALDLILSNRFEEATAAIEVAPISDRDKEQLTVTLDQRRDVVASVTRQMALQGTKRNLLADAESGVPETVEGEETDRQALVQRLTAIELAYDERTAARAREISLLPEDARPAAIVAGSAEIAEEIRDEFKLQTGPKEAARRAGWRREYVTHLQADDATSPHIPDEARLDSLTPRDLQIFDRLRAGKIDTPFGTLLRRGENQRAQILLAKQSATEIILSQTSDDQGKAFAATFGQYTIPIEDVLSGRTTISSVLSAEGIRKIGRFPDGEVDTRTIGQGLAGTVFRDKVNVEDLTSVTERLESFGLTVERVGTPESIPGVGSYQALQVRRELEIPPNTLNPFLVQMFPTVDAVNAWVSRPEAQVNADLETLGLTPDEVEDFRLSQINNIRKNRP